MPSDVDHITLNRRIEAYYRGERISNAVLFFIGGAAITWTFLLFYWRQGHLSSGFFFSTLPLGMFYIISGGYRFLRSFKRYGNTIKSLKHNDYFSNQEMPVLQQRIHRFQRKRNVNTMGFIFGFIGCVVIFIFKMNHIFLGTSVSITIFSAILLAFDLFSQFRVEEYLHYLEKTF